MSVTLLLLLPPVQTFLAGKATSYLKDNFNISSTIGRVQISFPNNILLKEVYVEDDHNDTLIYAQRLKVRYGGFNGETNTLKALNIELENGRLYMRKYQEDSLFNFAIFLQKLSSGEVDTTPVAEPFKLKIAKIDITRFGFNKHRLGCTDTCTNIFIRNANIHVDNFSMIDGYVSGDIKEMNFRDTARFTLHEFRGKAAYQSKYMSLRELYFRTDQSEIEGEAILEYGKEDDFNEFLDLVAIRGKFIQSTVSSSEFRSYIPQFPDFDNFRFSGEFDGTVNHFDVENCIVNMGENTRFFGEVHIDDPSESDLIQIKASVGEMITSPDEFRKYVGQFTGQMEWMDFLDKFKKFEYQGKYEGTVKDFDVNGRFKFDENELTINGRMLDFDNLEKTSYNGFLSSNKLLVSDFVPDENIGYAKFKASVKGNGLTTETLNADVFGEIGYIELYGYKYQKLKLDGKVSNRQFDGAALLDDPNLKLDFQGLANFNQDTVKVDFKASVIDANAIALGLSDAKVSMVNLVADIDFKFYQDSWWEGTMDVFDVTYLSESRFYFFDSIQVVSTNKNKVHNDRVISRIVQAELVGDYNLVDVYKAFYYEYLDINRLDLREIARPNITFDYDLELLNTDLVTDIFLPELTIESGTKIFGSFSGPANRFDLKLSSDLVGWNKMKFQEVNLVATQNDSVVNFNGKVGSFGIGRQNVDSIQLVSSVIGDSAWYSTKGIFRDSIDSYFRLEGYAFDIRKEGHEEYFLSFTDGRFNIGNNFFSLIPDNFIHFKPGEVEMSNIGFFDDESSIVLQGYSSEDPTKVLRINASNVDAEILNYVIRYSALDFKGKMSGDAIISNEGSIPKLASELAIDSLWINGDFIGNFSVESNWDIETGVVAVNADIQRNTLKMFKARGNYYPDSTGIINFDLTFDRLRLMWIDPFVDGILSNVRGVVSGEVNVSGAFNNIITNGDLYLNKGALNVPYFETDYSFEGSPKIEVRHNKIILPKTSIRDTKEGTQGNISGEVTHQNFNDWAFDLNVDTKNMLVLDTENSTDAYFYGKGYAGGNFTIKGPINDLSILVDITTNKGTNFKIPFSNPTNVGTQSFITYTGTGSNQVIIINPEEIEEQLLKPLGGLDISINANITPDANIELVMDETVGDIIRGRGTGNLRIDIPHDGDMQMFGRVEVASGDYLFTMRNIINKKFLILPGGTITWRGDPYEAIIDMKAKYSTRTTLTGIVTNNYDGQRVQVDLIMALQGPVTNPNINFEIDLPSSNASYQEELNNRLSDPDKLNVQAFSLLVINAFWTESMATESGFLEQGAGSNTMQMASAQFSNWIAQGLGDFIDISVGYNTATTNELSDEIELDISKDFFEDRVTINSKIDVPVGSNTASSSQNFTGDIEVIYKITRDGRIRAKAFNRNNQDNPALDKLANYTQGVGIFYQTNFNTYREFIGKIFGVKPKEESEESTAEPVSENTEN